MSRGRLLALAALAAALTAPAGLRAETIAFVGATVHPASGPAIPNGTIIVTDDKITAVGAGLAVPAGATRVVWTGKHVYPGLISPSSALGLIEVGTVRGSNDVNEAGTSNPNVRAEVEINPDSDLLPVARLNGITTAQVVPRGGAIMGSSALVHLDGWTYEDMTVHAPVGMHVTWPNMTPVRSFNETRSDEEQKKAREEAMRNIRNAFDDARAYTKAREAGGTKGVPRHDQDLKWEAMRKALRGEIPFIFTARNLNQIRAVLAFVDEQKLPRVVLEGADDAWMVTNELRERGIAVITAGVLDLPGRRWQPYDEAFTLPAKLHQAGVPFCISDGGGSGGVMNARNLPYEAAMAAAFGLPREEALKAITLYPAQILGAADRIGSIEPGKLADFFVTDGDLFEITTHVEQVYIAGRAVKMESRQTRLFQKYDARPRGPEARPR